MVATAGLTTGLTAGPARSAPDPGCPAAYPIADLVPGDAVTGLTVTTGTTPSSFTGTVQGVLEDGIARRVDLVLADLSSPTVDRVGIWSGMSGSPVYAANGDLIGAVSYSLAFGPSTIAGITPASEMEKLLAAGAGADPARRPAGKVAVPKALAARMVRSGAASAAAVEQGFRQIRMPVRVSGMTSERMTKMADVLDLGSGRVVAGSAGRTATEAIDIVAGGNLAASMSYGTVVAAGLGTATLVCGDEVVAFGHPMNYSGPSTMSLHGARAVLIQEDPTVSGFKVANLGAPVGSVDGDRLAGLHAVRGALPASIPVTADATAGAVQRSATTHVTVGDLVPQLAFSNMIAAQDSAIDRIGTGTAWATWTIKGLRKNGTPFQLVRRDLFTDPWDVSVAPAIEVADAVSAIQDNSGEVVKITSVDSTTHLYDYSDTYVISRVQARRPGTTVWRTLSRTRPLVARAGHAPLLKVILTSRAAASRTYYVRVMVPQRAAGRAGTLLVAGGNDSGYDSDSFFDEGLDAFDSLPAPSASTLPALLSRLEAAQQHNQIRATVQFRGFRHGPPVSTRRGTNTINRVVAGSVSAWVIAR